MKKFKEEFGSEVWKEFLNKIGFMNGDKFIWWIKRRPIQLLRHLKSFLLDKKITVVIGYKNGIKETYKMKVSYYLYNDVVKKVLDLTTNFKFESERKGFVHLNLFLGSFKSKDIYKDIFIRIEDVSFIRFK